MGISKESIRGLAVSAGTLWVAALLFAIAADQHFDGVLSHELPPGAPRNSMDFQSRDVLFQAGFLSVALALHWVALGWKDCTWRGFRVANIALAVAFASTIFGWFDRLIDDYYQISFFCVAGGERIWAIDVGWACKAAYYARDFVLPITTLLLLVTSFIIRLSGRSNE